jgi:hypothetical protein
MILTAEPSPIYLQHSVPIKARNSSIDLIISLGVFQTAMCDSLRPNFRQLENNGTIVLFNLSTDNCKLD